MDHSFAERTGEVRIIQEGYSPGPCWWYDRMKRKREGRRQRPTPTQVYVQIEALAVSHHKKKKEAVRSYVTLKGLPVCTL